MEDHFYNDLLVELECPICTNYMSPPIRQCATGHSICETCRRKLPKCPLCQGKFTDSRNITLEGLTRKMKYPCVNKQEGCAAVLNINDKDIHESNCDFRGFQCAMEKCDWVGQAKELKMHWSLKKMSSKPYHANNVCHTKMKSESYYVNIVDAHNSLFWFKCKLVNNRIFWAVQYVGKEDDAGNFYYEIEIFRQGLPKRKMLLTDYCQSIRTDNYSLLKETGCLWITVELLERFIVDDQVMYNMRVHPVVHHKDVSEVPSQGTSQEKYEMTKSMIQEKKNRNRDYRDRSRDFKRDFRFKLKTNNSK